MGTLFDYLNWRGDLKFSEAPLNEVDSLIFSLISYMDLKGIVPTEHRDFSVSINAAANSFFANNPNPKKVSIGLIVPKEIITLFRAVKDTVRFRDVEIKAYVNVIDQQKEMQFSATTYLLDTGETVVAYRGTDDTLIGWKENFNMSFLPVVPAQTAAVEYLNQAAKHVVGGVYVTGHSKGGNLAVYAAVHCEKDVRSRLLSVWCNDGPGFGKNMLNDPDYIEMRPIIKSLVPQNSVVGMLLKHDENYTVIKSRQAGLLQHDGLTWNVFGSSFVHLQDVAEGSKRLDRTLNTWIQKMTPEQREQFTDSIYQILSADNATTLTELMTSIKKNQFLPKYSSLDPHVRQTVQQTLSVLFDLSKKNLLTDILKKI